MCSLRGMPGAALTRTDASVALRTFKRILANRFEAFTDEAGSAQSRCTGRKRISKSEAL
jgi:hypothetical protein